MIPKHKNKLSLLSLIGFMLMALGSEVYEPTNGCCEQFTRDFPLDVNVKVVQNLETPVEGATVNYKITFYDYTAGNDCSCVNRIVQTEVGTAITNAEGMTTIGSRSYSLNHEKDQIYVSLEATKSGYSRGHGSYSTRHFDVAGSQYPVVIHIQNLDDL